MIFGPVLNRYKAHQGDLWNYTPKTHMDVSENRGTPKWMIYNGNPYYNGWFGGIPIFRKHPYGVFGRRLSSGIRWFYVILRFPAVYFQGCAGGGFWVCFWSSAVCKDRRWHDSNQRSKNFNHPKMLGTWHDFPNNLRRVGCNSLNNLSINQDFRDVISVHPNK